MMDFYGKKERGDEGGEETALSLGDEWAPISGRGNMIAVTHEKYDHVGSL
jgi:hypothetical protein